MQFPESWLREFCDPDLDTAQLADVLTMAGFEVEESYPVAPAFTGVVVAEIVHAEQHPNADRLRVCKVNAGDALAPLQIVCGAPNARVGIKVPLACVGAQLPSKEGKPFVIKVGQLRGVESHGMLCSGQELGLDQEAEGLLELPDDAPIGLNIREYLQLDDVIFNLKLTPNLAHGLSIRGIAREVAALTGAPFQVPAAPLVSVSHSLTFPVDIQEVDLCGRFSGRVIQGLNAKVATPLLMKLRLERCGQRSISPLVDIANYVMFELGQPSHMFDYAKLSTSLSVRWAQKGEQVKLLNEQVVELDSTVGVVADAKGVQAIAGIMGGQSSAVSEMTQAVFIETAFWWPSAIAGRARRYGLASDAAHRFERGVDAQLTIEALEKITAWILQICGGQAGPIQDQLLQTPSRAPIALRLSRAKKVIGLDQLTLKESGAIFERLGQSVSLQGPDEKAVASTEEVLWVTPASYRFDLQIEEDLIEELARIIGFDRLPFTPPLAPVSPQKRPEKQRHAFAMRRVLASLGYQETINFSFVHDQAEREWIKNENPIQVLNPIASQFNVMRSSLLPGLVSVLKFNLDRQHDQVRIFEYGRTFIKDASIKDSLHEIAGIAQKERVAGLAYGSFAPIQWGETDRAVDFYDVKGDIEAFCAPELIRCVPAQHPAMHPGRCAQIQNQKGDIMGYVGEMHPRWRQACGFLKSPIFFELEAPYVLNRLMPVIEPVPKQPLVQRDLAIWLSHEVRHDQVIATVRQAAQHVLPLKQVMVFDVYRPQGESRQSMTLRLLWGDGHATLTDEQVQEAIQKVLSALNAHLSAQLRA